MVTYYRTPNNRLLQPPPQSKRTRLIQIISSLCRLIIILYVRYFCYLTDFLVLPSLNICSSSKSTSYLISTFYFKMWLIFSYYLSFFLLWSTTMVVYTHKQITTYTNLNLIIVMCNYLNFCPIRENFEL